jgi:hypothetical protein
LEGVPVLRYAAHIDEAILWSEDDDMVPIAVLLNLQVDDGEMMIEPL